MLRKLGVNLGVFPGLDRAEDIAYVKQAGFDATFAYYHRGDADAIRKTAVLLDRASIQFDTVHGPFWTINDLWHDNSVGEEFFSDVMKCIDVAAECHVPTVILHLSSGDHPPMLNDLGTDRIDRFVALAHEKNVTLAFENQRKISNLAYVLERYEDDPAVGFCWDVGHERCLSGGWECMPMFGHQLRALHIHDNPCYHNADFHMIPGDGGIDYVRMAEHIRRSGYTGTMMLELMQKPSGKYDDIEPSEYFRRAYAAAEHLRSLTDGNN